MTNTPWDDFGDRASARRAAARSLHPDAGGDAALFTAALAEIDRRFGPRAHDGGPLDSAPILIRRSRRGAMQARVRTLRRRLRRGGTLPLGRRRYLSL